MADKTEQARRASVAVFGNASMAKILLRLAAQTPAVGDTTTGRKIASATGIADSQVRAVLWRLVDARVLDAVPKIGGPKSSQIFQRRDSDLWQPLMLAAAACDTDSATTPDAGGVPSEVAGP